MKPIRVEAKGEVVEIYGDTEPERVYVANGAKIGNGVMSVMVDYALIKQAVEKAEGKRI